MLGFKTNDQGASSASSSALFGEGKPCTIADNLAGKRFYFVQVATYGRIISTTTFAVTLC